MSLTRIGSGFHLPAPPPPSPIPTAKGSRSAANPTFSEYLDNYKSLNVPDLILPEPHFPLEDTHRHDISYGSLRSGDSGAVDRLLTSARELGVFRIADHRIPGDVLRLLAREADRNLGGKETDKERVASVLRGKDGLGWDPESLRDERYQAFRETMEEIASKLDEIAQFLHEILVRNAGKEQSAKKKKIEGKEWVLSLYRENNVELSESHALCLYMPLRRQSQFFVEFDRGPWYFDAASDTILVTVGKHIEEWSMGEFKSFAGKVICEQPSGNQPSFSIELKCLSLDLNQSSNKNSHTISIWDQILIGLVIALLYNIFAFLCS